MAETASKMLPLGTPAPHFTLPDTISGNHISWSDIKSNKATVVMFICNHCPYVKLIQKKLVEIVNAYQSRGINFVAISSNDAKAYPNDAPDKMRSEALQHGYIFPYLYDETQEVAKSYQAACTPDFYIFDRNEKCIYRGRFDSATPGNGEPVSGQDLRAALDAILNDKPISSDQKPSLGCNIKWKR